MTEPAPAAAAPQPPGVDGMLDALGLPIGRWDASFRLLSCNAHYVTWAGRPREALVGRTLAQLYGESAWAAARNAFAAGFAGRPTTYERRLTHQAAASGARWVRVQVFPECDAAGRVASLLTVGTDIHDDVLEREAMRASRKRMDRFTDNIPYPLTYVDRGCVLRFVNKAYVDATGQPAAQLLGRHIGEVRGPKRWAEHRPWFDRALAGETVQYTRLTHLADRGPRWMRTSYVPDFDDDGAVIGLYTITVDVHELTVAQERLKRSAERDALTDALSRRTMMERIEGAMTAAGLGPMALFFIDLDGFKALNDRLGHAAGDRLLVAVAQSLAQAVRSDDAVGRFGGDEFLVLAGVRDAAGAHVLGQHLLDAVRGSTSTYGEAGAVTASIGYAVAPADTRQPMHLLQLADEAMYAAKRAGKDRIVHGARPGG